jgi:hypothetical protein
MLVDTAIRILNWARADRNTLIPTGLNHRRSPFGADVDTAWTSNSKSSVFELLNAPIIEGDQLLAVWKANPHQDLLRVILLDG